MMREIIRNGDVTGVSCGVFRKQNIHSGNASTVRFAETCVGLRASCSAPLQVARELHQFPSEAGPVPVLLARDQTSIVPQPTASNRTMGAQYVLFAVLLVPLGGLIGGAYGGSCREATLCCNGRDSSCVVQKAPLNAIIEDLNDKPCYCDHACLKLGDCCDDFKSHCGERFLAVETVARVV
uniref:SMB domain-containing protein n=1 Tax=Anopheles maculatus TaxID=74869 RepID=A0A182S6J6_9DIPT